MSWLKKHVTNPLSRLFRKERDRLLDDLPGLLRRLPLDEADTFLRAVFSYLPATDLNRILAELAGVSSVSPEAVLLRAALAELPEGALQGIERRLKDRLKGRKR
jgi:hypothetical protein